MEGALLLVLFSLSGAMEDAVTNKAKGALSGLHKLAPTRATVVESDGTLIERAIKDIALGTRILVKAEQIVPLDGTVIDGITSVNLVHLTGESLPVTKRVGDEVAAGARNLDGAITIEVTRTSADSTLAKIIELVTQAQEARPALQRWFDSVSRNYAMTIILLSAFFALAMPFVLSIPFLGTTGSIYRSLAFLIAASPCALIIAIPIAYLSAVSICAKQGILLKGGITLDALAGCHAVAFDKTGTLTTGELTCVSVEPLIAGGNVDINNALAIAAAMEKNAVHPIANAIVSLAAKKELPKVHLKEFRAIAGFGLEATVSGTQEIQAYIGRPTYVYEKLGEGVQELLRKSIEEAQKRGELVALLLVGTTPFLFRFRDTIRQTVKPVLQALQKRGWRTIMLTGDHQASAQSVAKEVGIQEVYAGLTPADKLEHVTKLAEKDGLAMVGDGVNDAPALARATVGICMGQVGSTAAIDAADVVLLHDNIEKIDWIISKAQQTQRIVKENLAVATGAIIVASLPALGGLIPLWLAVVMHEGGTILVGLNALRLLRK
jgi:heavy metal translocating P-type ATPase